MPRRVNGDTILFDYIIDCIYVWCSLHRFMSCLYYHEKRREYFKRDVNFQHIYVSSTNTKETVKRYCTYYELLSKNVNRFLIDEVFICFHIEYSSKSLKNIIIKYYEVTWLTGIRVIKDIPNVLFRYRCAGSMF